MRPTPNGFVGRSQEVNINETYSDSDQLVSFDKKQKFIKFNRWGKWQCSEQGQDFDLVF